MMSDDKINEQVRLVFEAVSEDKPYGELRELVREAQTVFAKMNSEIADASRLVTSVLRFYGRQYATSISEPAEEAALPETLPEKPPAGYDRHARTMEHARRMITEGADMVTTEAIAELLRAEGDQTVKLTTAVGNILNYNGWSRERRGVYEPPEAKEDE